MKSLFSLRLLNQRSIQRLRAFCYCIDIISPSLGICIVDLDYVHGHTLVISLKTQPYKGDTTAQQHRNGIWLIIGASGHDLEASEPFVWEGVTTLFKVDPRFQSNFRDGVASLVQILEREDEPTMTRVAESIDTTCLNEQDRNLKPIWFVLGESHNGSLRCRYLRLNVDGNLRWEWMATQENMGDAYVVVSPLFCMRLAEQSTSTLTQAHAANGNTQTAVASPNARIAPALSQNTQNALPSPNSQCTPKQFNNARSAPRPEITILPF
ncbi:hypothetical protein VNO77_19422 [Canavalia gladiata]|uniref:Uncharacterized protein n=1 Tax=Canavalia gladiata TaxID=3824 RepID=A0AAN9LMG5_CANGL